MELRLAGAVRFIILLIIGLLPFIRGDAFYFGDVAARTILFYGLVSVAVSGWFWLISLSPQYLPGSKRFWILPGCWLLVGLASSILAPVPWLALFSTFERMTGWITYLFLFLFFLAAGAMFRKEDWPKVVRVLFIAGVLVSGVALYKHDVLHADGRIKGTLGNPSFLALYILLQIGITVLLLFHLYRARRKYPVTGLVALALPLHLSALLMTGSRSAVLALGIGATAALAILAARSRNRIYWFGGGIALMAGLVFAATNPDHLPHLVPHRLGYLKRLFEVSFLSDTFLVRRKLWGIAVEGFFERPFFGWGYEGFSVVFLKYYDPSLYRDGLWYDNSHSIVFELLVNTGLAGLLTFFICLGYSLVLLWKSDKIHFSSKAVLSATVLTWFAFNLSNFDSINSLLLLFLFWAYIQSLVNDSSNEVAGKRYAPLAFRIAAMAVFISGGWFSVKAMKVNKAIAAASEAPLAGAVGIFSENYYATPIGRYDILIQTGLKASQITRGTPREEVDNYRKVYSDMLSDGLSRFRNHAQLLTRAGYFYSMFGQPEMGIRYFRELAAAAPRRQANQMNLGMAYLQSGMADSAGAVFSKVFSLDTSYQLPLIYLAISEHAKGQPQAARERIASLPLPLLGKYGQLVAAVYPEQSDKGVFCSLFEQMTDRKYVTQKTYWQWIDAAFETGDSVRIRTAFNCYRFGYDVPEALILPVMNDAIYRRVRPTTITQFYKPGIDE